MPKGGNGGPGGGGGGGGNGGGGGSLSVTIDAFTYDAGGDSIPRLSGTGTAGEEITIYANNVRIGTVTVAADGTWTYDLSALDDGNYVFGAEIGKGKNKVVSDPLTATVDTTAPVAPVLSENNGVLTINGEAGAVIDIFRDGAFYGQLTLDGSGSATLDLAGDTGTFTATATDEAGNVSAASGGVDVADGSGAPAAPVIIGFTNDTNIDGDGVTADPDPIIEGTAAGADNVDVYVNSVYHGSAIVSGDGSWSYDLGLIDDGSYEIIAIATNADGASPISVAATLVVDTADPAVAGNLGFSVGGVPVGTVTNSDTVTLSGTGEPGAEVAVYLDGSPTPVGTVTVPSGGNWSLDVSGLADGSHTFDVVVSDLAGNTSITAVASIEVDTAAPAAPMIAGISDDSGAPGDRLTNVATQTITGNAEMGATVRLYDGLLLIATVVAVDGNWAAEITLNDGDHSLAATAEDAAGNVSAASAPVDVTIDTQIDQTFIDTVEEADGSTSADMTTADTTPRIHGRADANAQVTVVIDTHSYQTTADGFGDWVVEAGDTFADGLYSVTATALDAAGNSSFAAVALTIDTSPAPPQVGYDPGDPLYDQQWHLARIGGSPAVNDFSGIERVWADYTGAGVSIGIYDDGIEYDHPDLADNYLGDHVVKASGGFYDPYPTADTEAKHGTAVAGVIAGVDNEIGVVGVAHGAWLTGINIFSGDANVNAQNPAGFVEAIEQISKFDVTNHSWGGLPVYIGDQISHIVAARNAIEDAAATGRGGLGTITLKAAGNWADSAQGDYLDPSRHTITVGAANSDGDVSWYSNRGANLLVSAPSSGLTVANPDGTLDLSSDLRILTTDRQGSFGYSPDDYTSASNTSGFGGTSSATPTAAGVAALMLEANSGLGWRDVQDILAYTAVHSGGDIGVQRTDTEIVPVDLDWNATFETTAARPIEYYQWDYNGATDWNGGGLHFSQDYGFGVVDAFGAVRMAEVWDLFQDAPRTTSNELTQTTGTVATNMSVSGAGDLVSKTLSVGSISAQQIEYVEFSIELAAVNFSEAYISLTSPSGTTITLMDNLVNDYAPFSTFLGFPIPGVMTWTFGSNAFRGENPLGDWVITLGEQDNDYDVQTYGAEYDGLELRNVGLTFHGTTPGIDNVYHYTAEALDTITPASDRLTLTDEDGGIDWVNIAATWLDVSVDLAAGEIWMDGTQISAFSAATVIENAITGDGADHLAGDGGVNELHGMRGADVLQGNGGADILAGGTGDDRFIWYLGDGSDRIEDFTAGAGSDDVIILEGTGYQSLADMLASGAVADGAEGVELTFGTDQILLVGVGSAALHESDFAFDTLIA